MKDKSSVTLQGFMVSRFRVYVNSNYHAFEKRGKTYRELPLLPTKSYFKRSSLKAQPATQPLLQMVLIEVDDTSWLQRKSTWVG